MYLNALLILNFDFNLFGQVLVQMFLILFNSDFKSLNLIYLGKALAKSLKDSPFLNQFLAAFHVDGNLKSQVQIYLIRLLVLNLNFLVVWFDPCQTKTLNSSTNNLNFVDLILPVRGFVYKSIPNL